MGPLFPRELGTREMRAQLPASSITGVSTLLSSIRQFETRIHKKFLAPELIHQQGREEIHRATETRFHST